jgi:hypothetical protein
MFRRKNNSLPTTSLSLPSGDNGGSFLPSSSNGPDGSGKAIKMDAPVVKAWKTASGFTRGSYYILCLFIVLVLVGVRYLRFGTGKCVDTSNIACLSVSLAFGVKVFVLQF